MRTCDVFLTRSDRVEPTLHSRWINNEKQSFHWYESNECCKTREIFRSRGAANVQLKILFEAQLLWGFISKPCNYPDALYKRKTHQLVKWVPLFQKPNTTSIQQILNGVALLLMPQDFTRKREIYLDNKIGWGRIKFQFMENFCYLMLQFKTRNKTRHNFFDMLWSSVENLAKEERFSLS